MGEKIENENGKKSKKKRILILAILLLILLILIGLLGLKNKQSKDVGEFGKIENVENAGKDKDGDTTEGNGISGDVDTAVGDNEAEGQAMVSENYRVSQVKFGGNAVIENGRSRDAKLEILQVKGETIISQEDGEPRIMLTWKTNKEATSTVDYAKSDGKNPVALTEDGYGFEHSMLIKNMEFATIYTYKISARDKWGNKVNTEYFSTYTGDKSESIFDLITNAVEDVFGWAM